MPNNKHTCIHCQNKFGENRGVIMNETEPFCYPCFDAAIYVEFYREKGLSDKDIYELSRYYKTV